MNVDVKFTYKDLLTAPEDRNKYEIFQGELIVTPSPNERHQSVQMNLTLIIGNYVKKHSLGKFYPTPFDVYFNEETVVEPDILFVSKARLQIVEQRRVKGAPDVVIEILSESTENRDRGFKFELYAREGVKEYWLVDPRNETIEIYNPTDSGYVLFGKFKENEKVRSPYFDELEFTSDQTFE